MNTELHAENFYRECSDLLGSLQFSGTPFFISRENLRTARELENQCLINHFMVLDGPESYLVLVFTDDVFMLKADGNSKYSKTRDAMHERWELLNGVQYLKIVRYAE